MIEGPCAHCGSPDRRKQCRYTWWLPYREDWKTSGCWRPCDADEYEASMERGWRRFRVRMGLLLSLIVAIAIYGFLAGK